MVKLKICDIIKKEDAILIPHTIKGVSMAKIRIKYKISAAFIALFMICFSVAGILRAFATTSSAMLSFTTSGDVTLDGVSGAQVTVSLTAAQVGKLYVAQGRFSATETDDSSHYFVINSLTPGSVISGYSLDSSSSSGQYYYKYSQAGDGVDFAAGDHLYELVYSVAPDTPAGTYHLPINVEYVQQTSIDDYEEEVVVEAVVTVTRNETPATKPSQVVTFVTGGNTIGSAGVTKSYGDANFIVTKTVTTGDGHITEYHPDDDGTGSIAHTIPDGDYVGVGIPGDVDICAWVEETENYAATQACYTVHVTKRRVEITDVTIADKSYNGLTDGTATSVSFSNQTQNATLNSSDYTTDTVFADANAGENKNVTVTVTLVGEAVNRYTLESNTFNTTKTITPYVLTADNMELLGSPTFAYSPDGVEPEVRVTANTHGGTTTLGSSDYEVSYSNNDAVGTGHASVTGKVNFTTGANPVILDFTIEAKGINNSNLEMPSTIVKDRILTEDDINVKVDGHNLVRCATESSTNCDYTVEISGNNDGVVGSEIHVGVTARGNYTGVATGDVTVVAKQEQTVTIGTVTNTTVNATYGDTGIAYTASTTGDGTISYASGTESVATVDENGAITIVGVGDAVITATASETATYASASASYTLHVSKKTIALTDATVEPRRYNGTTSATVTDATLSDNALVFNTDYIVTGAHFPSANVNTYDDVYVEVTLSASASNLYQFDNTGAVTASVNVSSSINSFVLSSDNTDVVLNTTEYSYDGEAKKPTATVTVDLDGDSIKETTLVADTDYTLSYYDNINAGTATVLVNGRGNFVSTVGGFEFTITPAIVTNVSATAPSQTYNGSVLTPVITVTGTVNGSNKTFTTDDYEVAAHVVFVNAGDHTFTISSKDGSNYNIPATNGTFTIDKAESGAPAEKTAGLSAEVGKTLADLGDLSEGFAWSDPTTPIEVGNNEYVATYTKNGDTTNYTTVIVSVPVIGYTGEYEIIDGDGQEYVKGGEKTLLFEIDADYDLFEEGGEVYVDNTLVDADNYDSRNGSTIIEFKKEFSDGLALGGHSFSVLFSDGGLAKASFTVVNPVTPEDEPGAADTGVFTSVTGGAIATGFTAIVASCLVGAIYIARRKNS